jgi:hypothetical protein
MFSSHFDKLSMTKEELSHFDKLSVTKEELSHFDRLSVTIGIKFNVSLSKLVLSSVEGSKTDG